MERLHDITSFLDTYLEIDAISDNSWNGLQFEGSDRVKKIVFAVDAAYETFNKSLALKAEMIVVHHGHFWRSQNPSITGWAKKRTSILSENNISLYACHLPLDRHKTVGNNAQILKLVGAKITDEFIYHKGMNIGWIGELKSAKKIETITSVLSKKLGAECTVLPFGKEKIKQIAVCSGGGGYAGFYESLNSGADLYITGDSAEVYYTAKDAGINVIFAGHHCTETIGLQALRKKVQSRFNLQTTFLDMPTGL
jgi:dinuclear metal center YbgI/SA1388 family protein